MKITTRKIRETVARGEPPPRSVAPAGKITAAAVVAIVAVAVVYHTLVAAA